MKCFSPEVEKFTLVQCTFLLYDFTHAEKSALDDIYVMKNQFISGGQSHKSVL
jgi:hypothetical protein